MGDRAQVKIIDSNSAVYLYTHNNGGGLARLVRDVCASAAGQSRKQDSEYLARIIFSRMIRDDIGGETGFGIGTSQHGDLDNPLIVVNCDAGTIDGEKF